MNDVATGILAMFLNDECELVRVLETEHCYYTTYERRLRFYATWKFKS